MARQFAQLITHPTGLRAGGFSSSHSRYSAFAWASRSRWFSAIQRAENFRARPTFKPRSASRSCSGVRPRSQALELVEPCGARFVRSDKRVPDSTAGTGDTFSRPGGSDRKLGEDRNLDLLR